MQRTLECCAFVCALERVLALCVCVQRALSASTRGNLDKFIRYLTKVATENYTLCLLCLCVCVCTFSVKALTTRNLSW